MQPICRQDHHVYKQRAPARCTVSTSYWSTNPNEEGGSDMPVHSKVHSQSGFMSVEAVATTLFYLIMVTVITLIASQIMNSGKMASTYNALSMARVNIQYVGTNVGSYANVDQVNVANLVPGLLTPIASGTINQANLPISRQVEVTDLSAADVAAAPYNGGGFSADAFFKMEVSGLTTDECRKLVYYGAGGGYDAVVMGGTVLVTSTNLIATAEGNSANQCGYSTVPTVTLVSR